MNYQKLSLSQFDTWKLCEKLMISPRRYFLWHFWSLKNLSCLLPLSVTQHFCMSVWNYTDDCSPYPICLGSFHSNSQFLSCHLIHRLIMQVDGHFAFVNFVCIIWRMHIIVCKYISGCQMSHHHLFWQSDAPFIASRTELGPRTFSHPRTLSFMESKVVNFKLPDWMISFSFSLAAPSLGACFILAPNQLPHLSLWQG